MAHRQRVALGVQIGAPIELARLLLGVQGLTQRIDRFVEVGRREVGTEGVNRAQREGVRLALGNEVARLGSAGTIEIARLAEVLAPAIVGVETIRILRRAKVRVRASASEIASPSPSTSSG